MATSGPNSPASGTEEPDFTGPFHWTAPGNIVSFNSQTAYVSISYPDNGVTCWIYGSNFGFSIPAGATINGITAEIYHYKEVSDIGLVVISGLQLRKAGSRVGSNLVSNDDVLGGYTAWGGASNLWGTTWSPSDINNSGFGVSMQYVLDAFGDGLWPASTAIIQVEHVRITVTYTPAGGGAKMIQARQHNSFLIGQF